MFAVDDHGRFACFCQGVGRTTFDAVSQTMLPPPRPIPQIDTTGMSDAEKAKIPPINRLNDTPTAAEAKAIEIMLSGGPEAIGLWEYAEALKEMERERKGDTETSGDQIKDFYFFLDL